MPQERVERKKSSERWISEVETTWERIPEYEVDSAQFKHLAVICDGNRRAAEERGLDPWLGHRVGVEVIKGIAEASRNWGIKHLTFWVWSTENWKREREQIDFVMSLAFQYLNDAEVVDTLVENRTKFVHFGRKDRIPTRVRNKIEFLEEETKDFSDRCLNLALDYGGFDEIARGVTNLAEDVEVGRLTSNDIAARPEVLLRYLDTADQPVPDLVVRTGAKEGEVPHTSGFMPIQTAYSGWSFLPDLFPDMTPRVLLTEIKNFEEYERRIGR